MKAEAARLLADAEASYDAGHFVANGIARYGATGSKATFDATRDRTVMPAWVPSKERAGRLSTASRTRPPSQTQMRTRDRCHRRYRQLGPWRLRAPKVGPVPSG